jgi:FHA domain-containing protein
VLRATVREEGQQPLPAVDIDDAVVVIGSGSAARIRLPARVGSASQAILPEHVRVEDGAWRAFGEVRVAGMPRASGDIGDGVELELGAYRVQLAPAPAGVAPAPPQRTESLARELIRSLLGDGAAPTLELVRGPGAPAKRALAPPESRLVIGRGDEATWIIIDNDLSRVHAEIRRGWDGTRIIDLDSKNGTKVDGTRITDAPLHDGAEIELGKITFRFHDPADRHLRPPAPAAAPARSHVPFYVALAVMALALAGLVWILAS